MGKPIVVVAALTSALAALLAVAVLDGAQSWSPSGVRRSSRLLQRGHPRLQALQLARARLTKLWDLEEGGPTDADQGVNYNPVVIDDAVSRRGYPALVTGWREWGCDGESLQTEFACVNTPDNHGADFDDDYMYDSYGRGGRFTGHFTEDLDI